MTDIVPTRVVRHAELTPLPDAATITTLEVLRAPQPEPQVEACFPPAHPVLRAVVVTELATACTALFVTAVSQALWPLSVLVGLSVLAVLVVAFVVHHRDTR